MSNAADIAIIPHDDDALMDEHQLQKITGFSLSRIRNDRYLGKGFPFVKIGASVRYTAGDYRKCVRQLRVEAEVKAS